MLNNNCYVYKWTHIPTLMWYVGSRTAKNCSPDDGYICSSKVVEPLVKANPDEWERTIVATGTAEEMLDLEFNILDVSNAIMDKRSYNMANGNVSGIVGKFKTDQHKESLRQANLGKQHTPESKAKMRIKRLEKHTFGWKWSEESRQKFKGRKQPRCSCIDCKKEFSVQLFYKLHKECSR